MKPSHFSFETASLVYSNNNGQCRPVVKASCQILKGFPDKEIPYSSTAWEKLTPFLKIQ
jgi:hypothetical protein